MIEIWNGISTLTANEIGSESLLYVWSDVIVWSDQSHRLIYSPPVGAYFGFSTE